MTAKDEFNKQFQELLRIGYEGKWIILSIFVVVVSATGFYTMQQDDIYQSRATIRLNRSMDPLNQTSVQQLGAEDLGFGSERIIANEIRVLRSEAVLNRITSKLLEEAPQNRAQADTLPIMKAQSRPTTIRKIARKLGLEDFFISVGLARLDTSSRLASHEVIASRVRGQLRAEREGYLDMITVIVVSTSPTEAARIANLAVEAYQERNLESARENILTVKDFLESQLESKRDSLKRVEVDVRNFKQTHGIVSLPQESQSMISQLSQFEAQRDQAKIELEAGNKVLSELKLRIGELEPNLSTQLSNRPDPVLNQLLYEKEAVDLEIQKTEFGKSDALKSRPDLQAFSEKELKDLKQRRAQLVKEITEITGKIIASGDVSSSPLEQTRDIRQQILTKQIDNEALKAKIRSLDVTLKEYNREFDNLPAQSLQFARLERMRQSNEKLFTLLDGKYQEAVINEKTTVSNVRVVDQATVPGSPIRPDRPKNMLIGVLFGLGLGFIIAMLVRYLDSTIRNPEDVEKLGIPVLTFVPSFGNVGDLSREDTLVVQSAPQSPPSEAYRTMRAAIENSLMMDGKPMTVLVTSPAPKEGKSTAIANLAVTAANLGKRVLLIDADLRRPVQHSIFEVEREPGLSDCLTGAVPVNVAVKKSSVPRLHVVTSGHIPSHPAELLGSIQMEKFLQLVRQYYDFVLIDSPPIIAMADTLVIAKHTDGVVLVVSADQTKTMGLVKAKEMLAANNARFIGAVVNRFNANKIYYSYYRYYYQNYYYYSDDGTKKKRASRKEQKVKKHADASVTVEDQST
jgi:polysaccharide biosynthesis transport protein